MEPNHSQKQSDVTPEVKNYLANALLATGIGAGIGYLLGRFGDNRTRKVGQFFLPLLMGAAGFFLSTFASKKLDKRPYDFAGAPDAVMNNQQASEISGTELLPGSTATNVAYEGVLKDAPQRQLA